MIIFIPPRGAGTIILVPGATIGMLAWWLEVESSRAKLEFTVEFSCGETECADAERPAWIPSMSTGPVSGAYMGTAGTGAGGGCALPTLSPFFLLLKSLSKNDGIPSSTN